MLVVSILAIIDSRNKGIPKGMEPLAVGLLVVSLSLAMGANCSCAINPARDLGPRLFTYVAGWGQQVFRLVQQLYIRECTLHMLCWRGSSQAHHCDSLTF